jgi:hypothetical protein
MAGGAVGHPGFSESSGRAVEAFVVGFEAGGQEAVLPAQGDVVVAAGANLGHLGRVDLGVDVFRSKDIVFAVAIRADGDILDALDIVYAVNTFQVALLDSHVAGAAGFDDVLAGD